MTQSGPQPHKTSTEENSDHTRSVQDYGSWTGDSTRKREPIIASEADGHRLHQWGCECPECSNSKQPEGTAAYSRSIRQRDDDYDIDALIEWGRKSDEKFNELMEWAEGDRAILECVEPGSEMSKHAVLTLACKLKYWTGRREDVEKYLDRLEPHDWDRRSEKARKDLLDKADEVEPHEFGGSSKGVSYEAAYEVFEALWYQDRPSANDIANTDDVSVGRAQTTEVLKLLEDEYGVAEYVREGNDRFWQPVHQEEFSPLQFEDDLNSRELRNYWCRLFLND